MRTQRKWRLLGTLVVTAGLACGPALSAPVAASGGNGCTVTSTGPARRCSYRATGRAAWFFVEAGNWTITTSAGRYGGGPTNTGQNVPVAPGSVVKAEVVRGRLVIGDSDPTPARSLGGAFSKSPSSPSGFSFRATHTGGFRYRFEAQRFLVRVNGRNRVVGGGLKSGPLALRMDDNVSVTVWMGHGNVWDA